MRREGGEKQEMVEEIGRRGEARGEGRVVVLHPLQVH